MTHEAVFWDVGGVILDIESIGHTQRVFLEAAIEAYDLPYSVEEAQEIWRDALRAHFAEREGREYRTAREGRAKAAAALFDGAPPADWEARYEAAADGTLTLNPGAAETLRRLDAAGVYQAIVSDADAGLAERLADYGVTDYVTHVTTSEEVGYVKPDSRMFETAFRKARAAGVDPETGVMIGDKYENDMEGAAAAGLTTVAFGAAAGPAVDHRIEHLRDLPALLGLESDAN